MTILGSIGYFGQGHIHMGKKATAEPPKSLDKSYLPAPGTFTESTETKLPKDVRAAKEPKQQRSPDEPISLNSANEASLDRLPGIGPTLARRIIEYRNTNGPFQSLDDLKKVQGIGTKLFGKISRWLVL